MDKNELRMKKRGEDRVWKALKTSRGNEVSVATSQLGQQTLAKEAEKLSPILANWSSHEVNQRSKKSFERVFQDREQLTAYTLSTLLALTSKFHLKSSGYTTKDITHRMSTIRNIYKNIFDGLIPEEDVWRFVEKIVDESQYFELESKKITRGSEVRNFVSYNCLLPEEITEKLESEAALAFYPLPMLVAPIPWSYTVEDGLKGGYESYPMELIRGNKQCRSNYLKYSRSIFDAVNYIQKTAWEVNEDLVNAVEMTLQKPDRDDYIKNSTLEMTPGMSPEVDIHCETLPEEERQRIIESRKPFYEELELHYAEKRDFESALGKYRAIKISLDIAKEYIGETIYFPHNYDSRGRIYPIPIGLTPQGSDAVKAMLKYKEGQVLNKTGEKWCWAYLASLFGDDKLPFNERVERGKELIDEDWQEADEPYQFLAHQLEMKDYLQNKTKPVSIRIHLDACNSGSQFTSAITGDKGGCEATNVIPSYDEKGNQIRRDAYIEVAQIAERMTDHTYEQLSSGDIDEEKLFFNSLLSQYGRKICKQPVMVSNYGGTAQGRSEILYSMMRELGTERVWVNKKTSSKFSKVVGDAIGTTLKGGKAFEMYIHRMCVLIAKEGVVVEWTTPDGFFVRHEKNKVKKRQISCKLSERTSTIVVLQYLPELNPQKMKSAVAPNYIHSLDAMLLRRVALEMQKSGIEISDWIHDSFGCQPNDVETMLDLTKKEFIKLVKNRPLKKLHEELTQLAESCRVSPKQLEMVKLPQLREFNVNTGLNCVLDSDWFFS